MLVLKLSKIFDDPREKLIPELWGEGPAAKKGKNWGYADGKLNWERRKARSHNQGGVWKGKKKKL